VGFDPALFLMEDWPYRQVTLQILERLFDGNKLRIVLPQRRGIVLGEVGPQTAAGIVVKFSDGYCLATG
jgi:hypothetical protein